MWLWFWDINNIVPYQLLGLTKMTLPTSKSIIFTDRIHSKLELDLAELSRGQHKYYKALKRRSFKIQDIEAACFKSADVVVAMSAVDAGEIAAIDMCLSLKVKILGFAQSPWDLQMSLQEKTLQKPWDQRKNLVFLGDGFNGANRLSMQWYIEKIAVAVKKDIPGVKLLVIGDGWEHFKALIAKKSNLTEHLIFLGALSRFAKSRVIGECKLVISPVKGTTSMTLTNALALSRGIPLITTPSGS